MNSQLVIFRAFLFYFFRPPEPRSKIKIPINQLIKQSGLSLSLPLFPYFVYARNNGSGETAHTMSLSTFILCIYKQQKFLWVRTYAQTLLSFCTRISCASYKNAFINFDVEHVHGLI